MKESKANRSSLGEGGGSIRAQSAVRQTRLRREAEDLTVVVCPQSKRSAFGAFNSLVGAGVPRLPRFPSTHLVFHVGDIARWFADHSTAAIVNAANQLMLGTGFVGSVDGAIHQAAGPDLLKACYDVPEVKPGVRLPTGEARITQGFRLSVSHVIHTAGPLYGFHSNPKSLLRTAYRNIFRVAHENDIEHIAIPALSCGRNGFPLEEAATIAMSTITEFANDFKEVHFVLFDEYVYSVWLKKANELLNTGVTQLHPIGRRSIASMDGGRQGRGNGVARILRY